MKRGPTELAPLDPARVAWVLGYIDASGAGVALGTCEWETVRAALVQLSGVKFAPDVQGTVAELVNANAAQQLSGVKFAPDVQGTVAELVNANAAHWRPAK